ncbi:hypothetical protein K466DRAFT_591737 [Polyporus arcularius HHB13444]|uniref:HNH nuclease domain-containing protein n=1 Tax=Polyporus arcularius HHB13444 TaxID=1314778 RepID=A0A5C3NUC1_9APHY|nr:hypothetical protein K466DRAFT_591737 [Polyporus arcularius HHB13444]
MGAIDQVCYELGNELLEQFVRPFMRRRFETSAYDSGDEYDSDEEKSKRPRVSVMLEQAPQNARYAKMVTLYRDVFRCKLTDTFDVCSLVYMPLAQRIFSETEGAEAGQIYNRHIIPDLAADGLVSNEPLWDLFAKLGLPELRAELADGIHRLENMLTLRADVCGLMDDLNLCLTPVKGKADGNYNVVLFGKYAEERESVRGLPEKKAFWLSRRVPNPSTKYLRIHATCSYIAHYSGAIEWSEDGVISRVIRVGDDQCDDEDVDIHHFVDSDGDVIDLFSLSDIDDDTDADTCN